MPEGIAASIREAYAGLDGGDLVVAVRSSATAEDLPGMSFAGQQDTYLNMRGEAVVLDAVKRCWASLWTARAIDYRARNGIAPEEVSLAVVVQELVPAEAAGVMFTANPLTGARGEAVINAAWGLGESIVGGHVTPDTVIVDKASGTIIEQRIQEKEAMTVCVPGGTREQPVPADQRQGVPHHLIDLIDPAQAYSAAQFCSDARAAIADIRARGKLPLLVGGTMLYFKTLRDGLATLPSADAALRAEIESEALRDGWPAMHALLAAVDADTAARLAPNDSQRIVRALEVWRLSGQPISVLQQRGATQIEDQELRFLNIALEPPDRAALHARIAVRFAAMLHAGFIDEVATLRARGDMRPDLPAMRCVGYRQIWNYLDGRTDRMTMCAEALAATRQLAKRQLTWLRALPDRRVIDSLSGPLAKAREIVGRTLG